MYLKINYAYNHIYVEYCCTYIKSYWTVKRIFSKQTEYPTLIDTYSILNHLPACQILDSESTTCLPDIRSWITCLPARYSMRYPPKSPACLPNIRFWIIRLPAKYSILNHLPACLSARYSILHCLPVRYSIRYLPESLTCLLEKCTENTVLFCLENAVCTV